MSSNFTVLYDANIFFGAFRQTVIIHLAQAGIYRAKWTEDIHQEWMRNLREKYPDLGIEKIQRIRGLIDAAVPDCLVHGYRRLVAGLELPDSNDRHVLAAAIKSGAQVIVTCDVNHFPDETLSEYDIQAQHPDDFLMYQKEENLSAVLSQLRRCRKEHRNPAYSVDEFIDKFRASDLSLSADWLSEVKQLL
jgi:PIN domain